MNSILVDTGPLVALVEPADKHHTRATRQFDSLRGPLRVGPVVLVEAHFLLSAAHQRARLHWLLTNEFVVDAPKGEDTVCARALIWLEKYADHEPDFVDAFLIAWAESETGARIWTFDSEFSTIWRTSKGRKPLLAAQPPRCPAI